MVSISASANGAMIASIGAGASLSLSDQVGTGNGAVSSSNPVIETVTHQGDTLLMAFGQSDWAISGLTLEPGASISSPEQYHWGPDGIGLLTAMGSTTIGGTTHIYAASITGTGLRHYVLDETDTFTLQDDLSQPGYLNAPDLIDFEVINTGTETLLIAASSSGNGIESYLLDANGTPTLVSEHSADTLLPVGTPTKMATGMVGDQHFVILAAAGSSSLTVLRVDPGGELTPVDHVIDNKYTRFSDVTELATVEVDGRLYIVAGGSDDGLSLFTLLPDGALVHLDTIWDTNATALQNISALETVNINGQIAIFATSETEAGITRFTVDPPNAGVTLEGGIGADTLTGGANADVLLGGYGDDTLSGGGGRDILNDGDGQDTLTGGAGADLFRLSSDSKEDTITDFDPSTDTIDLSGYHMLYDASQLQITSRSWGAIITYRDEVLNVYRAGGGSLDASDFKTKDVLTLDRPPSGFDYFPETVSGTTGNDTIAGNPGFDTLHGMAGDDVLMWSGGGDLFYGGAGSDTVSYALAAGGVLVNLTTGETDHAALGEQFDSIENLIGSAFADVLVGNAEDNILTGGDGDDILCGGAGNDWLDGGAGLDSVSYALSNQAITISLLDGTGDLGDTLISIEGVVGSDNADNITGDNAANRLVGGGGADLLFGLLGNDELFGNRGNDLLDGGEGDDILDGGTGDDHLLAGLGADQFIGGDGTDTVDYSAIQQRLIFDLTTGSRGGAAVGDQYQSIEVFIASNLNDNLGGSDDAETLIGNGGDDIIRANGGDDNVQGGTGDDRLWGGTGNDLLYGGAGDDILNGQSGDDRFFGGAGVDTFIGGGGVDIADYSDATEGFIFNFATGTRTGAAADDVFDSIEGVAGGKGADTLTGADGDEVLEGGGGRDLIDGGAGNDTLIGGGGKDTFLAGDGADWFDGSAGFDTLDMRANTSAATVDLSLGEGAGSMAGDRFVSMEKLLGTRFADRFIGDAADNRLEGRNGADTLAGAGGKDKLLGGKGADQMIGGNGNDRLWGHKGNDSLAGSSGRDILRGGSGRDTLDGGAGKDVMYGGAGRDTFLFNGGADRIRDFNHRNERLLFDMELWGGGRKSVKKILKYAEIKGQKAVFDFGGGDKLVIDGVTSLSQLNDNIDFY